MMLASIVEVSMDVLVSIPENIRQYPYFFAGLAVIMCGMMLLMFRKAP